MIGVHLKTFIGLCVCSQLTLVRASYSSSGNSCYDDRNQPQRCLPEFVNAAFNLDVEATNTCGDDGPTLFCKQTETKIGEGECQYCEKGDHPPSHMTDISYARNQTWWQSDTMLQGIQYPTTVNLTLHLKKAYDITYVQLKFQSPRPESFAIYKRTHENGPWIPFQFYSGDCRYIFGIEETSVALESEETKALCTSEYSDISPTTEGIVAFSTLEGRASGYSFDYNPALQEWVTATDIKIVLTRLNTFGDEWLLSENAFSSYYYAISEISIGARCKCNGHAGSCHSIWRDGELRKVCKCEHDTTGDDCERCADFYQDTPWRRASSIDAAVCNPCNCNGYSNRCFFDRELYEESGHGGHCLDCAENRDGPNCERCRDNYYLNSDSTCLPCQCNEVGSRTLQCNSEGKCDCKPGVTGEKCDRCALDFYDFSSTGCKPCNCELAGSLGNQPSCDQTIGKCICKENVEGKECNICKPGHFNLDEENEFGCTPCFCYGHSSVCDTAGEYSKVTVESMFARNREKWNAMDRNGVKADVEYDSRSQTISVTSVGRDPVYFVAPERFLGDQRASYNQDLEFRLKLKENGPAASVEDIIIESNKLQVSQTIIGQGNKSPSTTETLYRFRLHEHPDFGWEPRLSARDFMSILSNITAIKIRGTYTPRGAGSLDDVKLGTARRGAAGQPAKWIEWCQCPTGYVGQFCESCAPGYRHDPPYGGPFANCVPCNCHNHTDICDPDTGRCICQHNTAGENCERCARGYYGNAVAGTENDCQECPCPNQGACYQLPETDTVICLECPKGYAGARCDQCSDGYFGDVDPSTGKRMCKPCDCNGNVDLNAVNNCDRVTGQCLKCIYNTGGAHCDQCLPGYYGDALAIPKGDCKPCRCDRRGTESSGDGPLLCDQISGQCQCKPNVTGINCDQCKPGYFNIDSGKGCEPCRCNAIGSTGSTCDLITGQCDCRPGIARLQCDMCQENYYGFSVDGCLPCECDSIGSVSQQCNATGWCPCLENVEGKHCDRCKENKYDKQRNCVDCPACYSLVQDEVNKHRENLKKLNVVLENIIASPTILDDEDFDRQVKEVEDRLAKLWEDTKKNIGDDNQLSQDLKELQKKLVNMTETLNKINKDTVETEMTVENAGKNATAIHNIIEQSKKNIQDALDYINTDGKEALQRASERAAEFGQQNQQMSDIADEARKIVATQLKQAEEMKQAAENALDTCEKAYKLSLDAREKQENASRELDQLETKISEADDNLKKTTELANQVLNETSSAYQDSLDFAIEIGNLGDPKVDPASIKSQAITAQQEARNLQSEIDRINKNFLTETEGLDEKINETISKLNEGRKLQQEADVLLAEADAAYKRAEAAVENGTKTLQEAEETLATLQGFDEKIQAGRKQAFESIQTIPNIKELLQEANEKTKNAEEALHGAEINAQNARNTAETVQNDIAQLASKQAQEIREKAQKTRQEAEQLTDQVKELEKDVAEVQESLKQMEDRANEDMEFTKQAKEKVGQAKTNADEATEKVEDALQTLNNIMKELSDLSDIDEETLQQLEHKLNLTEQQFKNANLDEQLEILTSARLKQQQQLKSYEEELARLTIEVEKVQSINEALPDVGTCWKRNRLEP